MADGKALGSTHYYLFLLAAVDVLVLLFRVFRLLLFFAVSDAMGGTVGVGSAPRILVPPPLSDSVMIGLAAGLNLYSSEYLWKIKRRRPDKEVTHRLAYTTLVCRSIALARRWE